jgi:uncharacterized protein
MSPLVQGPSDAPEAAARLDRWFDACPSAAVAFSGGVDSALVAFWALRRLGAARVTAFTADSPSFKRSDLELARSFCAEQGIPLRILETRELDDPRYAGNPVDRCFHCKETLYRTIRSHLEGAGEPAWVLSGANLDDQSDYRPGLVAAAEASVRHPLLECGIGKETVRTLAREMGLRVWDKPASPCLSSRIPYGQRVTVEKLSRIEAAEAWLLARGFPVCRVRHDEGTARVEVPRDRIRELALLRSDLSAAFSSLGFSNVEIDREGLVSGKLNRGIGRDGAGKA